MLKALVHHNVSVMMNLVGQDQIATLLFVPLAVHMDPALFFLVAVDVTLDGLGHFVTKRLDFFELLDFL